MNLQTMHHIAIGATLIGGAGAIAFGFRFGWVVWRRIQAARRRNWRLPRRRTIGA